jgi:class 3 adenylate cyclase
MADAGRKERKVVTVVFADLVGFTGRSEALDPEDVEAILGPYHARLRSELERHGGTVEKFIGDAVMAVFGAPVAHEDDPERAVRAALAICDWAADDGALEVRIAVNTGPALVSLEARPEAGEAMVAGDVVNTAARLQAAAPVNGILVGETTYRATRAAIDYGDAEPVAAKGKAEPVRVWEAVSARARFGVDLAGPSLAPLVGRSRELDLLGGALARSRQERAVQLVTLVGVPGIGKSRLVAELFALVEADPDLISWRQGRSLPYGEGVTFWAVGEMVKAQAGILEGDPADEAAAKLHTAVAAAVPEEADAAWVEDHLRPLVGLAAAVGRDSGDEVFGAWRRFFEALAETRPLVLVFEDLHWADDRLLDFVDHLVDWTAPVPLLVVGTARPELFDRRPGWGGGKLNALTVALSPLPDDDTARLIGALLDQAILPAETQAALLERAGGNPLYAEQYVRMFQERGSAEDLPLPENVQGIIEARLDGLPAEEKSVLQDAAVIGKVFWAGVLKALGAGDDVGARLHALERKDFVRRERRSSVAGESEYAFRHFLARDVAYGQIPRAARAEKHRLAAEWIESLGADRAEDKAEMLAHHYVSALEYARASGQETASLVERSRHALRDAGDRAAALAAYSSASRLYARALELWPEDDPGRATVLFKRFRAAFNGEGTTEELAEEARSALLATGERGLAAEVDGMRSLHMWVQGDRDAALARLERAEALVAGDGAPSSRAHVLALHARFLMLTARHEEVITVGREAIELAEAAGLEELRANALNSHGIARIALGEVQSGLADLEESLSVAERLGTPEVVRAYGNLASVLGQLGELRRSAELHGRGRKEAERFGASEPLRWMRAEVGLDWYLSGDWTRALELIEAIIASSEAGEPYFMEVPCRITRGLVRLARRDVSGARADAEQAIEFHASSRTEEPQLSYPAYAFAARAAAEAGDAEAAAAFVDTTLSAWQESSGAYLAGSWVADLVVSLRRLGAETEFESVRRLARVQTRWLEAGGAYAAGDFSGAAAIYGEMGAIPNEAEARLEAAAAFVAAGDRAEADAQLRPALAFWRSVAASAYVRRGEALLAATG